MQIAPLNDYLNWSFEFRYEIGEMYSHGQVVQVISLYT